MSKETLSQAEIDALLAMDAPALEQVSAQAAISGEIQVYDFRRPHRVSRERLRALEAMYERVVKSLESWLVARMRGQVELRLHSIEPIGFGEFIMSLPTPCASYLVTVKDSGGLQGVIDIGYEFAYSVVDRLFGGNGQPLALQRSLTSIERQAVKGVADRIALLLQEVWDDHVPLKLEVGGFETVPDVIQAVNREDPVLVATVEASLPGEGRSLLLICLPFVVLDKFFSGAAARRVSVLGPEAERELSRGRTELSVRNALVPVSARLPEFRLTMQELSSLRTGSVVSTGLARETPVQLYISGQRRFSGSVGRLGHRLAVHVQDVAGPDDGTVTTGSTNAGAAGSSDAGADAQSLTPIF